MRFSVALVFLFTALVAVATAFPTTEYNALSFTTTTSSAPASSVTKPVSCCHCELGTPAFNKTFFIPCIYQMANDTNVSGDKMNWTTILSSINASNTTVKYKGNGASLKDSKPFTVALSLGVTVALMLLLF